MSPWEIAVWLLVILVGGFTVAAALWTLAVWRDMRDERDEMEARRRMAAAINKGAMTQQSFRFRVVDDKDAS